MTINQNSVRVLLETVYQRARDSQAFENDIQRRDNQLWCRARFVDSLTHYRVSVDPAGEVVWVGLFTPDRWLSESIEADLMHQGDKLEELLEEELYEQGYEAQLPVEHFRDEQMQYVFRSPVAWVPEDSENPALLADRVSRVLLAYEAAFQPLGDMSPTEEFG